MWLITSLPLHQKVANLRFVRRNISYGEPIFSFHWDLRGSSRRNSQVLFFFPRAKLQIRQPEVENARTSKRLK